MKTNARYIPQEGDYVCPDDWTFGENLVEDNGFSDSEFPGCEFRLPTSTGLELAVNVKVTGKDHWSGGGTFKARCKIEFVGDGDQSTFTGGWIYHN